MSYRTIQFRVTRRESRLVRVRVDIDDDVNLSRPQIRERLTILLADLIADQGLGEGSLEGLPEVFSEVEGWTWAGLEVEPFDGSVLPCELGSQHDFSAEARRFEGHKIRVELLESDPDPILEMPPRPRPRYRRRELAYQEWEAEGEALYGKDRDDWRFECPSCGISTSIRRWRDLGAPTGSFGFSCEGRWAGDHIVVGKLLGDIRPCNYAGGGLLCLNPITILLPDGSSRVMFPFAASKVKLEAAPRVVPVSGSRVKITRPPSQEFRAPVFDDIADD